MFVVGPVGWKVSSKGVEIFGVHLPGAINDPDLASVPDWN